MKRTAEPTVIETVSRLLLGGFALELDGMTLTDDINRSLQSVHGLSDPAPGPAVSNSEFIETFWPDDNSSNPVNALKTALPHPLHAGAPVREPAAILAQRGAHSVNPAVGRDPNTDRFRGAARPAGRVPPPANPAWPLPQALSLYQGGPAAQAGPPDVAHPPVGALPRAVLYRRSRPRPSCWNRRSS